MKRDISKISQSDFEICVVGGGINGAAVAHMAALNGFKTVLLEKGDFASGTSSKSTKLIHGGLRYLENLEFDLVRESLRERFVCLKSSPHLVKPLRFIIPVYKSDQRPLWLMKAGVFIYDLLSGRQLIEKHQSLTNDEVIQSAPSINADGLCGGIMYTDAQMNDARICLENVLSAHNLGAEVANYVEVKSFIKENGRTIGVEAVDQRTGNKFIAKAKKIVCAIGPWTNKFLDIEKVDFSKRIRTTKGIHIVYRGQFSEHALILPTGKDHRFFFIIPWHGNSLIGTTDTDFTDSPDRVETEDEDVDYLFREARKYFPRRDFNKDDIIATFSGLRPLVYKEGSPSKLSRKHVIRTSYSGVTYVMGGKYTTYRKIAEDCLRSVSSREIKNTRKYFPLYGSGQIKEDPQKLAVAYETETSVVENLMEAYGVRYKDLLALIKRDPTLKEKICDCSETIKAQIKYSVEKEMVQTADDIYLRRLSLGYLDCSTRNCRKSVDELFKRYT